MAEILKTVVISQDIVSLDALTDEYPVLAAPHPPCEHLLPMSGEKDVGEERLEQIRSEAFQSGLAQAQADSAGQMQTVRHLLQGIPAAIQENRQQLSDDIADIVLAVTEKFLIHQLPDRQTIADRITQTINLIHDKETIELALHPRDLALLRQGELNVDLKQCKNLRVIADESLRLGGCRVKSEHGLFDAGIERQVDRLKEMLLQIQQGQVHE